MIVKDGDKIITLEELARQMCRHVFAENEEACWDGSCPAAKCCRHGHNGMIDWLRKLIDRESED